MAMNWTHEYPTGTPLGYIRDDIIEMWERSEGVGIYKGLVNKEDTESHMEAVQTMAEKYPKPEPRGTRKDPALNLARSQKKYVHNWRNPPDEDSPAEYKIEGPNEN